MRLPRKVDPSRLNATFCFLQGIIQPAGPLPLISLSSTAVLSIKLEDLRFSTISRRHSLLYLECTCQFRSTFVSSLKKDAFDNCLLGKMD